jgi:16S rRNA (cytosine967-C5)-methyltransferase
MAAIARRVALTVLTGLDKGEATLDSLLSKAFRQRPQMIQADRALATELVFGVLRWRGRLDWVIEALSTTPRERIDPPALNTLRLGLYQILFLSRIPVSAAVNDSVDLSKEKARPWVAKFVNAVLRTAADRAMDVPLPDEREDPLLALAVGQSHPLWMVRRWAARLGLEQTGQLCEANNRIPPVTVRTNTLKISRARLLGLLQPFVRDIRPTGFSPEGLALRGLKKQVADMAPYRRGLFQVQDEGAQLIAHLLDPRPGETVLDACAGLGGKTGHLGQLMANSGVIQAVDRDKGKLRFLREAMKRLGVSIVTAEHCDLAGPGLAKLRGSFHRILLDAPCSGLGVLRRNPDIKWKRHEADLARLRDKQQDLLEALVPLVKRGGRLVYCVCSLEPEEGEEVAEDFLKRHKDFVISRASSSLVEIDGHFFDKAGFFRTVPQEHGTDGFFAVSLQRMGS